MPSSKYMELVDEMVEANRTKLEAVFTNDTIRLHNSVSRMKEQLNNTLKVSVATLKDIASVIGHAADYVKAIQGNQTGSIDDLVKERKDIVEFGNDTIQYAFQPHYAAAENLSRNVSRLLDIIDINTNYARRINLEFCLSEKTKPLRISCLQSVMKSYLRYLIRVKNALKTYNDFNISIQRKIDNVTRSTVIRAFQKAHGSSRNVVKDMFESSTITPDMLVKHTQKKLTQHSKLIKSYISRTKEKLKIGENVYNNFNVEYENYKAVFDDLQNLALFTTDIIVYSKNVTAAELEYVKEGLSKQSSYHFNTLADYYKRVKLEFESLREQMSTREEQLRVGKPANVSCNVSESGIAELFDCLHEKALYYSEMFNATKNVYIISKTVADNILENSDVHNRKVYDDFSLQVYNLTLNLVKEYEVSAEDAVSYEQTIAEEKYNDTLSRVEEASKKCSKEYLNEIQNKVTALSVISDVLDRVILSSQDCDNEKMVQARELLTEMNETVSNQYETGSDSIANKISNITEYSARDEMIDIFTTMSAEGLTEKCSIGNDSMNVVKVAHALQCIDREETQFNNSMVAVVNDYTAFRSELEETYALFLHDVQAALRNGIKNVLPLLECNSGSHRHHAYDALACVNKVDIRKSNSSQLQSDLNHCNSILAD